jgi:acyl-CoA synthetase (AMP-forming)/AMP-acid ligase II
MALMSQPMLLGDIIRVNARHRPDDEALIYDSGPVTYAELNRGVNRVAHALVARGVGHGDRVAVLGRNSLEYVQLYFALGKLGAMLVPLSFWHRTRELTYTVADSEPGMIFVEPELMEPIRPVIEETAHPMEFVALPSQDGDDADWAAFVAAGASDEEPDAEVSPGDAHMILYTSGTTGQPKGAVLSHRRTVEDAFSMALSMGINSSDTFINYFPSFHVANWDHMKLYLLVGARTVVLREFDEDAVLAAIERHRPTIMLGVPTMFHSLLGHPQFKDTDISSVRLIYYGAYDPSDVMQRTAEAFGALDGSAQLLHTYGLTEAGPFVCFCPPDEVFAHWGSIGRPCPGVEVALLDDDQNEVAVGEPGEICVRGPRMTGYWRKPAESEAALAGDWLHTGDMAVRDADGYFMIVDRKKDMIRSGGQNVYSKEIEDCLSLHDSVDEVAVIGLPDEVYEERICAVIVPMPSVEAGDELAEELKAYVRGSLAGYNCPKEVRFVEELPKNAVGKTQKHRLREQFGSTFTGAPRQRQPIQRD